jgi:hypothetical protein
VVASRFAGSVLGDYRPVIMVSTVAQSTPARRLPERKPALKVHADTKIALFLLVIALEWQEKFLDFILRNPPLARMSREVAVSNSTELHSDARKPLLNHGHGHAFTNF